MKEPLLSDVTIHHFDAIRFLAGSEVNNFSDLGERDSVEDFLDYLKNFNFSDVSGEEYIKTHRMVEYAIQSSKEGKMLEVQ